MSADNVATEPSGEQLTVQSTPLHCNGVDQMHQQLKLKLFTHQGHFDQMSDGDKVGGGGEVRVGGHDGHRGEDGRHRHQARLQVAKLGPFVVGVRTRSS